MATIKSYIPVSCDLIDQIEIFATSKKIIKLVYIRNNKEVSKDILIKTWETSNKEEFLVTNQDDRIRLDHILSIDGIRFENSCSTSPPH